MEDIAHLAPFWAKSQENGNGHPLLAHMLDSAAVTQAILERTPCSTLQWLQQQLDKEANPDDIRQWLVYWAGLHDIGKATSGFQQCWTEGKNNLEKDGLICQQSYPKRHGLASGHIVRQQPGGTSIAAVLAAHHGKYPYTGYDRDQFLHREKLIWREKRNQLLDVYKTIIKQGSVTPQEKPGAHWLWIAGLISVIDWIASNEKFFTYGWRGEPCLKAYYESAIECARKALDTIHWQRIKPAPQKNMKEWIRNITGQKNADLRPMQSCGMRLLEKLDNTARQPALILIEAPMGEGKTELALLAYEYLQQHNDHSGLYIALPTQATANAMYQRARNYAKNRLQGCDISVQLAHSRASIRPSIRHHLWESTRLNEDANRQNNNNAGDAEDNMWFSQRRRALLAPLGIGTVDQALLSCLRVRHHFVRLYGLGNKVVVLDEVHAYDSYTSGLIETLLIWLREMQCSVILMSATLPASQRNSFIKKWQQKEPAGNENQQYPLITVCTPTYTARDSFDCEKKTIHITACGSTPAEISETCKEKASKGGRGAIIVNTVERAQQLYLLLKENITNTDILLYHARFPAEERVTIEDKVLKRCGRSDQENKPFILVATQVAEQSLDADFDYMISDLAPVDLLLQRAGRLHRHSETLRPQAHQHAHFIIAGANGTELPDINKTKWKYIYAPYYLYATWGVMRKYINHCWQFPQDINTLVQQLYNEDGCYIGLTQEQKDITEEEYQRLKWKREEHEQTARNASIYPSDDENATLPLYNDDGEETITDCTRLLKPSLAIVPIFVDEGKKYILAEDKTSLFDAEQYCEGNAIKLYKRHLSISRKNIIDAVKQNIPDYWRIWQKKALLRNIYPIEFDLSGASCSDDIKISICRELGVYYP